MWGRSVRRPRPGREGPRRGRSSRMVTVSSLATAKTSGASDSHTPWPWHRSRSTEMRITPTTGRRRGTMPPGATRASPTPVPDRTGLLQLDHHLRVVVPVGVGRLGQLELPVQQQHREDGLQLHHGECRPDAAVAAGAEGDPGPRVGTVLLAWHEVPRRLEGVGIGEVLGDPVGHRGAGPDHLAGPDGEPVDLEVLLGHPEQQDQRRVEAQGLLDRRLQVGHLAQGLVADLGPAGVQLVQLAVDGRQLVGVGQQLDQRPGRRARGGVVAGEHHRDEHAGDLVGREAVRAVLVA